MRTPKGFREAYGAFVAGGWTGIACAQEHGGQGLPKVLQLVLQELISSTNVSFGTYPGLSALAYNLLAVHGGDEQKRIFLPKLVDGSWSATMCLTEPQCGSDLGLIQTRAEPSADNSYKITGTKIFITAGEHDLTENIVHFVLARLPESPPATEGLSLFIVPKFVANPNGTLGVRNGVNCSSIEHKMGLNASSTCVMNFSAAEGQLVGEPHKGMRVMFTMMNGARLAVGMQGIGLAETAYQSAVAHALERLQGRSLSGPKLPDKPADPIIVHPDVRKNLLMIRAYTRAARALALWIGMGMDLAAKHPDPARRAQAYELVTLMTPLIKALFTDRGFKATNLALQVFGGFGYIRDSGMEQLVRDARIGLIYEGTNGIQALDLVARKMPQHSGRLLRRFFHPASQFLENSAGNPRLREFVEPFAKAFAELQEATLWLVNEGLREREELGASGEDYLRLFGLVVLAYMWAQIAKVSTDKLSDSKFAQANLATARFYMKRLLPQTSALLQAIKAGSGPIMDFQEEWF